MGNVLNLTIEPQKCTQWCWAAVTVAVGRVFQDDQCPSDQCQVVNQLVNAGKDCCTECDCLNDPFDACNESRNLSVALAHFHYDRDGPNGFRTISFEDVKQEIDDKHPIAVSVKLQEDGAATSHAVVIYGYTDDGKLKIADPMHAGSQISITMDQLLAGCSQLDGAFETAYRTKRKDE
jgi:hypothetical protein